MNGPEVTPTPNGAGLSARLRELAAVFLKLGLIGFGGPAAHIGLMEDEFVRRRHWLSRAEFADLLAATNLIPGPNSTEMALYVGQKRAGMAGLVTAGGCFILPAMLMVMVVAWGYQRFGTLPQVAGVFYGVKPVMIAIVAQALWSLSRTALKTPWHALLGAGAAAWSVLGGHELLVLLVVGVCGALVRPGGNERGGESGAEVLPAAPVPTGGFAVAAATGASSAAGASAMAFGPGPLFLFFLKVGAVLYGSGYVLLAFLRADLVERWGWLSEGQLLDAIAVGQMTPGPLFTTATFIGYVLGGPAAAVVATVGIFLPAFVLVAVSGPLIPRLRQSRRVGAFLDGVVAASLALMGVVTWHLGREALRDLPTVLLALASAVLLLRFRVNSAWLVLAGAAVGLAASLLGLTG